MGSHVISEARRTCELFGTDVTFVRLITAVSEFVFHQVEGLDTGKVALVTFEWLFPCKESPELLI